MDLISDSLTRIRNASKRGSETVLLKKSKMILAIAEILKKEGFVEGFSDEKEGILVTLAYVDDKPVISCLNRVSRGGQRIYAGISELKPVLSGRGIGIVSTSQGVMTVEEARAKKIGGEYICNIW